MELSVLEIEPISFVPLRAKTRRILLIVRFRCFQHSKLQVLYTERIPTEAPQPITLWLREFAAGDKNALDRLIPLLYSELRRLANAQLRREHRSLTLQPTALVHEAYARLIGQEHPDYRNRAHFLGVASQVMRQVLIDYARRRNAVKRGGGEAHFALNEALDAAAQRPKLLIALDDALRALERKDPRKAKLVEMRFFGGLQVEEMAEILESPVDAVRTELRIAQAWLRRQAGPLPARQK